MIAKYNREPHAILAVDTVILSVIEGELHMLLIQINKPELKGKWAHPGGLVLPDEGLEEAAQRILERKGGLKGVLLDQLATFGDPSRDPFGRVVSVAYLALVDATKSRIHTTEEYDDIAWVPVTKKVDFAYDHKLMLSIALKRLSGKMTYTNIAQGMMDKEFTLTDLQEVYEQVLGQTLDKRNFRKKILSTGMITETGNTRTGRNRPAALYKFISKNIEEYEVL